MLDALIMFGGSFTFVIFLMAALWLIYLFQHNAAIVDIGWGISFLITAWIYFFLGDGDLLKKLIMTAMATVWAGRLTTHLFLRYVPEKEDPRYTRLREKWGGDSSGVLFLMLFIFQGVLVVILSLPFFLVGWGSTSEWSRWEFIGILVWLVGVLGEAAADKQLADFVKDPENKGKVCNRGLWRFSRHPNYFFEWVIWMGFFLFALPSYGGEFAVLSPIIMLLLLTKVSGIPLAEEESLASKGEAYREYQQATSAFIPWFSKGR
jgi:steroid 5-alpha reductase family enzyme